jgi:hypothetical protein
LNQVIEPRQISAVYEVLRLARSGVEFPTPVDAIEAFAAVACAFLSAVPRNLKELFDEAFADIRANIPFPDDSA